MKRRPRAWRRTVVSILCSLPLMQVATCSSGAVRDAVTSELARGVSDLVYVSVETIAANVLRV